MKLIWLSAGLLFLTVAFIIPFSRQPVLDLGEDTRQYIAFAQLLRSGEFFRDLSATAANRATVVRTPGFPLLLAAALTICSEPQRALLILHGALTLITLIILCLGFAKYLHPLLITLAFYAGCWAFQLGFRHISTEWTAFILVIWFFGCCHSCFSQPSAWRVMLLGLCSSFLALTKPALVPVIPLAVLIEELLPAAQGRRRLRLSLAAALLPVLGWMTLNLARLNVFSLTPFAGYNLFAVAALIGEAAPSATDNPDYAAFAAHVNRHKTPQKAESDTPARLYRDVMESENALFFIYNRNIGVAEEYLAARQVSLVERNRYMLAYAGDVIQRRPLRYLSWIALGLYETASILFLVGLSLLLLATLPAAPELRPFKFAAACVLALCSANLLLTASMELVMPRYYLLPFAVVLISAGLLECLLIKEKLLPPLAELIQKYAGKDLRP